MAKIFRNGVSIPFVSGREHSHEKAGKSALAGFNVSIPFVSGREHSRFNWNVQIPGSHGFNPLRFGAGALPITAFYEWVARLNEVSIPFVSGREHSQWSL